MFSKLSAGSSRQAKHFFSVVSTSYRHKSWGGKRNRRRFFSPKRSSVTFHPRGKKVFAKICVQTDLYPQRSRSVQLWSTMFLTLRKPHLRTGSPNGTRFSSGRWYNIHPCASTGKGASRKRNTQDYRARKRPAQTSTASPC